MTATGGNEDQEPFEAQIWLRGGDEVREFASLWREHRRVHALTGKVRTVSAVPGDEELGGAFELLTVALGSGGVGATLAGVLANWISHRGSDISVTVKRPGHEITVQAQRVGPEEAQALFEKVLRASDER